MTADNDGALLRACLARTAVWALDVSGAAISLLGEGRYRSPLCVTDEAAARLEAIQLTVGEGPGIDAHRSGLAVLESDLAGSAPDRWPSFTELALAAGARAVFAFPARVGAVGVGVVDLYRSTPGPLSEIAIADALWLADLAARSIVVLTAQLPPQALDDAVSLTAEVHQATGVLGARPEVGMDEALALLQARAYASGRLISEVAADVVSRRLGFDAFG